MRKKIEWQWEQLDNATWRAKTIGGWLVLHAKSLAITNGKNRETALSESMEFVADRDHEWAIVPPAKEERPQVSNHVSAGF